MTHEKTGLLKPARLTTKLWLVASGSIAIMVFFLLPVGQQAWANNLWSIQFSRYALNPQADLAEPPDPPAGHNRAELWLAADAMQKGEPALAERLISEKAAQGDPLAMNLMAEALLAQNKFAEAVLIGKQASEAGLLLSIGYKAQAAGSLEAALQAFEAAWKLEAETGALPLANFLIYSKQDHATAELLLRNALSTYPASRYWPAWSNRLGDVLRTQKNWGEAEAAYQATLARAAQDWGAHIGLGWVYYERGDGLQAAMDEFQLAITNPESKGQAQYAIGQVLAREKRYQEADTWFAQAIALEPDNRWYYLLRGNAARQAGDLDLALGVYTQAMDRFPDFAYTYSELAYAYQLNEQPEQAMAAMEQAVSLIRPPNLNFFLRAGSIFEWGGETEQALEYYRRALQIDPQNAAALAGVARLAP